MHNSQAIVLSFLLASVQTTYAGPKIRWGPCDPIEFEADISAAPSPTSVECGTLSVPLDYTDSTYGETLTLDLLKIPATGQPLNMSILFNFGGPGEEGRHALLEYSSLLQPLSGGSYDLIAFDPRGTANTLPFDCKLTPEEQFEVSMTQVKWPRNTSDPTTRAHWVQAGMVGDVCAERASETGSLISSAFTARDLISVVDALEEDKMLRFWGFSYGTTLGATVAAMFPDRIDGMIIDGVQNPHEYYHSVSDFEEWTDGDAMFSQVFEGCVAAGANCSLSHRNQTAAELEGAVWDLLDALYIQPVLVGSLVIDYTALVSIISAAFYNGALFPNLATLFDRLLDGDTTSAETIEMVAKLNATDYALLPGKISTGQATAGIHCVDNDVRVSSYEEYLPADEKLFSESRIMGPSASFLDKTCPQWKIEPKERYEGNFDVQTKNPVLVVSNTWDAYTPLVSAKNISASFEGSVVLEVRGWGHTTLISPSVCSIKAMSAYWTERTLPAVGTVCDVAPLYSNVTWADVLLDYAEEVKSNSTSSVKRNVHNARLDKVS